MLGYEPKKLIKEIFEKIKNGKILLLTNKDIVIKCKKIKHKHYMLFPNEPNKWKKYNHSENVERDIAGCLKRGDIILWE